MEHNLIVYKDSSELADSVSDMLMNRIAISGDSEFHVAISGGSTPNVLFSALASKYADSILWQKTHFWWVDERMVPPGDSESNYGAANKFLFSKIVIPAENIHRIKGENDPLTEADNYSHQITKTLKIQSGQPVFDLVFLGIGEDGHTASIFPNQLDLLTSDKICEVAHHPVTNQIRVTLTGQVLNNAAKICFLVTGANKAGRLSEIWLNDEKALQLPASHIHPINGELFWYADKSATQLLSLNDPHA